jgi:Protein of unknown function (DUF3565)
MRVKSEGSEGREGGPAVCGARVMDEKAAGVPRKIVGFHQDEEGHWVAELERGPGQHVRHDPPWMNREWVTTEEGRAVHSGRELICVKCGER